jgi:hypothetical protein
MIFGNTNYKESHESSNEEKYSPVMGREKFNSWMFGLG